MMRMMTSIQKAMLYIGLGELITISSMSHSVAVYMNVQMAYLSALFVILGSSYAYKSMVIKKVDAEQVEEKRDLLDEIEDPHGLYDDEPINEASADELDLKQIVKEEKAKIKTKFNTIYLFQKYDDFCLKSLYLVSQPVIAPVFIHNQG